MVIYKEGDSMTKRAIISKEAPEEFKELRGKMFKVTGINTESNTVVVEWYEESFNIDMKYCELKEYANESV